ncbi:MAG: ATP-binding cassette domain-containing protein, partial [Chloroflexota bacterium]
SEAVESLLFTGGFLTFTTLIELLYAGVILVLGSGGWLHLVVLVGWLLLTGLVAYRYLLHRERWTDQRLEMTHGLVEQMLGHRTRQMQGRSATINRLEDDQLSSYFALGNRLDRAVVRLVVGMPRAWLVIGLLPLLFVFLRPDLSTARVAIAIGGTLSAYLAFEHLTSGLVNLSGAYVAAERIRALWEAAAEPDPVPQTLVPRKRRDEGREPLLIGRNLSYRYPSRPQAVIQALDLEIKRGDRLLLKGGSGSGKSTLAGLIAGLRQPNSGLLLLDGFDYGSLGATGWHQRIASAPQFHENHVLTETFAFNLLMGRRWPPTRADVEAAYRVCEGLGLTPLLERMPGGMFQMVGETGWQLSHGERNRLFLARAILQGADLLIVDESLAGLDPETYIKALETIEREAETVIMISHR